jgi:hypothetical protein
MNGLLCHPSDPERRLACMRRIWKNRELTDQMGENGLRFAEAFCAESRVYEEMREYLTGRGLTA